MDKRPDWAKSYSREFRFEDAFELTGNSLFYVIKWWEEEVDLVVSDTTVYNSCSAT